jgi:nicotinamide mononucleotide (NMN) deamidase PncC
VRSLLQIDPSPDVSAPETASAMARAVQQKTDADYGLGIAAFPTRRAETPIATAASHVDTNGTLHVALASGDNVRVKGFPIATHPSITKARSAKQALNMLRLALINRD